jgi:hypothetical protein
LHAKLKIKDFELQQALEREALMIQSRDHFRNALISSMQPPAAPAVPSLPPDSVSYVLSGHETPQTPQSPARSDAEERLNRLRQQRGELIAGGFAADDRVIVALDQQIYRTLNN